MDKVQSRQFQVVIMGTYNKGTDCLTMKVSGRLFKDLQGKHFRIQDMILPDCMGHPSLPEIRGAAVLGVPEHQLPADGPGRLALIIEEFKDD